MDRKYDQGIPHFGITYLFFWTENMIMGSLTSFGMTAFLGIWIGAEAAIRN
jgi:hypothetical protein